jgi:hypothetical protein
MSAEAPPTLALPLAAPPEEPGPAVVDLLLRPDAFFAQPRPAWRWWGKLAVIVAMGLSVGIDRAEAALMANPDRLKDWSMYWVTVLTGVVIVGPLRWFVGGFWYRTRLRLAGVRKVDRARAQLVFAWSDLVVAVPAVVLTGAATLVADSPHDTPFAWTTTIAAAWSVLVSYRGVRAAFTVSAWKARVWFLIVPAVYFLAIALRMLLRR